MAEAISKGERKGNGDSRLGAGSRRAASLERIRFLPQPSKDIMADMDALRAAALVSKAWPYEEARKILKRYPDGPGGRAILFETGYGPSGLPHLGTFQEVARTLM